MKNITLSSLMFVLLITSCIDNQKDPDTNSDLRLISKIERTDNYIEGFSEDTLELDKKNNNEILSSESIESELNQLVKEGKTTDEIMTVLSSRLSGEAYERIKYSLENSIKSHLKKQLLSELRNSKSSIYVSIKQDFIDEVNQRLKQMDEAGYSEFVKKKVLEAMKKDFIQTYGRKLDLTDSESAKIIGGILNEPFSQALKNSSK
jgi:hypothetical protein